MSESIKLNKQVYNKNNYQKVIDTSFTQLGLAAPTSSFVAPTISVAEFFQNYQELFWKNSATEIVGATIELVGDITPN